MIVSIGPKIAVVGSRDYEYLEKVSRFIDSLPIECEIVSGGGGVVDNLAEQRAKKRGMKVKIFRADWKKYGKAAGPMRNSQIVEYCDSVVAFWDGMSKGTKDTITKAENAGKPVLVVHFENEEIEVCF